MTASPDTIVDRTEGQPAKHDRAGSRVRIHLRLPPWLGAVLVTAALVYGTSRLSPTFLRPQNLMDIVAQKAAVGIIAVGLTLVITAGGIDLSVGSLMALAGGVGVLVLGELTQLGWSGWIATVVAAATMLAIGAVAGLLNGWLIAKRRLPPFIATLAALLAFRAGAQCIANGGQFRTAEPVHAFAVVGEGYPIPGTDVSVSRRPNHKVVPLVVPYEVMVWAGVAVVGMVVLNRTRLGRYAVAVGSNARAARYSAVPVARVRILLYVLSGLLVGLAAFMEAARYDSVNSGSDGLYFELYAIAAAVIGGTRMEGGTGSVFGSVVGTLLLAVIFNVLVSVTEIHLGRFHLTINPQATGVATGLIIVAAAMVQRSGPAE
jgi:ribose transport system permease protein